MRERFIAILVGLTLTVIAAFAVPRAYVAADRISDQELGEVERSARFLISRITSREGAGREVDTELLASALDAQDGASYVAADGTRTTAGRLEPDPEKSLVVKRNLGDGRTLVLTRDRAVVSEAVQDEVVPLVLLGLVLALVAAASAYVIGSRTARPFRQLAEAAELLGRGRLTTLEVPDRGVREAVAIGEALQQAGLRLDGLIRREREFAANASHQLRTPITALRLSLEDLTLWPETAPEVRAELERGIAELDRLSGSIDDLLNLARSRRLNAQATTDLAELVDANAGRWRAALKAEGRDLVVRSEADVLTRVAPGPVTQILDVLVDNARMHGQGTVTVTTRDARTHLEAIVADEGERRIGPEIFQRGVSSRIGSGGNGLGLSVATELAEELGGHLSLATESPTTRLVLWLPHRLERRKQKR
ncbi:HAMP domain-containing histidine kinase [Nocardioides sp. zg-536]|uniref:histidine kinase n=1 Tax=Nocardioides faecalis TaxID=2803858 RepID=A0A939BSW5_9ACTN|nr:HAMP domain-containing sensor histidine kinase [Nocardioides faecalis]MBM9460044.1 HAMP domain-containing histidine kinase [Nocardioides faecalis]MBS4753088.1 HAMP domain-containing histidine kinase [Nocardioides faecalis]QVI58739.1 HAMP domain-containing histidine kinase [Nocardioides faecalis]